MKIRGVDFDIDKFAPGFFVSGKPFHKTGVAIGTSMLTADVGIDDIIMNFRYGKNSFCLYFLDNHL